MLLPTQTPFTHTWVQVAVTEPDAPTPKPKVIPPSINRTIWAVSSAHIYRCRNACPAINAHIIKLTLKIIYCRRVRHLDDANNVGSHAYSLTNSCIAIISDIPLVVKILSGTGLCDPVL